MYKIKLLSVTLLLFLNEVLAFQFVVNTRFLSQSNILKFKNKPKSNAFGGNVQAAPFMKLDLRLLAKAGGEDKKRKRKRRKPIERKAPSIEQISQVQEIKTAAQPTSPPPTSAPKYEDVVYEEEDGEEIEKTSTSQPTKFKFDRNEAISLGITDGFDDDDDDDDDGMPFEGLKKGTGAIDLPDIKDSVLKKKKISNEDIVIEEEEIDEIEKISRKDIQSFKKLLEVDPQADSDKSYFQDDDKYGTVSVLLAEGAKPFLGIPSSILQIGHFVGAIGISIMAFIEYPGFPLTNLPTPIRDALQGGLGLVYAVNLVIAIFAAFEAPKRGQPLPLWIAKTFTLGGLAFDQLIQLPTVEELKQRELAKNKRGRRR